MKRIWLGLLVISMLLNVNVYQVRAGETKADFNQMDAYLQKEMESIHIPGMAVTIVDKDEVLFSKTYGNCDDLNDNFLIGSLSKSFTAAAIMTLVEQGKVNLDDGITNYLPDVDENVEITVRQLLNQTSGMSTYQNQTDFKVSEDKSYCYASANYGLLGQIIESVSGLSYGEYLKNNIFTPLGMNHSYTSKKEAKKDNLITGYRNYFGLVVPQEFRYPKKDTRSPWAISAGYVITNAIDMGKYLQMYLNDGGEVLTKDSIDTMFYDNVKIFDNYYYGMGWALDDTYEEKVLKHEGQNENYISFMLILPESEVGLAILMNANDYLGANDLLGDLHHSLIQLTLGLEPVPNGENEYFNSHLNYDIIFAIVLLLSALPLFFFKRWKKRSEKGSSIWRIIVIVIVHVIIPSIILSLSNYMGFQLSVVWAFVPDLFFVLIISALLLYAVGIAKGIVLLRNRKKHNENI